MRRALGDASGAVADLGVFVPIAAALVVRNGFDPATVLVGAGLLYVFAGAYFRVPVPVQPIKAAAAITIASSLDPIVLSTAGVVLGAVIFAIGVSGLADKVARLFTAPIIRGLQLGVGLILLDAALGMLDSAGQVAVASAVAAVVLAGASTNRFPAALLVVVAGIGYSLATGGTTDVAPGLWQPSSLGGLNWATLSSAVVLLVIPQLPLTFGNAVAAMVDLEKEFFGDRARKVTPRAVSMTAGIANVVAGALGGMPMCHGSNGLTAHYRAGARSFKMNLMIGGAFLLLGLFAGSVAFGMFALIPVTVLGGLLAFTGVTHGALVLDQRGFDLAIALAMGALGFLTANLALALGLGVALYWGGRAAMLPAAHPDPSE